jgi:hypothetical protein
MRSPIFMTSKLAKLLIPSLAVFVFISCDNKKETLEVESPQSYLMPLQPGKSITYRLDSTIFLQAGRKEETHSYQEKHIIDAVITDNLGRTSYKIYRFLRDVDGTQPWKPTGTFVITPLTNTVEVIEDNMRVVALAGPIREGQTWKGNRYLASEPYAFLHNFSNDNNMGEWDFTIESLGQTETINDKKINDVLTVSHEDELVNVPIIDPSAFASKTVSLDKYAKGIGLVYQQHILWEYQPSTGSGTTAYYVGFGVTRSLLEHN